MAVADLAGTGQRLRYDADAVGGGSGDEASNATSNETSNGGNKRNSADDGSDVNDDDHSGNDSRVNGSRGGIGHALPSGCPRCQKPQQADGDAAGQASSSEAMRAGEQPSAWPPSLAMADGEGTTQGPPPERLHDLKHDSSVLAIAVSDAYIFAGTHDGEILIWSLDSFELASRIQAHKRSVLCLFFSPPFSPASEAATTATATATATANPAGSEPREQRLLVSSAGDATISVWDPKTFQRLYEIYSTYDVGDIFSVAYSVQHQTVYFGAQDTTIQWVKLNDPRRRVSADSTQHPEKRHHRFFDSKAVGGTSTPRRNEERWGLIPKAQTVLEVHPSAIHQFAHYGYIYCMLMARGPAHNLGADEEVLITGGGDGTVKLWKIGGEANSRRSNSSSSGGDDDDDDDDDETGGTIREAMILGEDDAMSVLSLAIDGSFLYCGKLDGVVELWDLDTRQRLRVIKAHNSDVMTLQMNWGYLWSASANGFSAKHSTVHYGGVVSSTETVSQKYQCLRRWKAHDGKILASATTTFRKTRLYITGANDEIVSVWRVPDQFTSAKERAEESEDVMIRDLRDFVSYKTISSRPEFAEDCHRGATFLCTLFKRLGGEVQMLQTREKTHNPVVCAKFAGKLPPSPSATTRPRKRILFYGHYDVVAADTKKGKWASDPFTMKGMNGYLYGRGVSDNKGPIMAALYAVTDLLQEKQLESDVIFLIEGEEEAGSRGFQETVRAHQDRIGHIDYILLANSYWLDDETPCLTYGLRGVLHATVCVDSAHPDLHSGVDGSYLMAEPLSDLTLLLSKLKAPRTHRVLLPRFYDSVLPLQPAEEARFDAIARLLVQRDSSTGAGIDADVDVESAVARRKAGLMARWREPNLTVHRYKVSGPDGSLVSCHACANISFRLVPGQEVSDVAASLTTFLRDEFDALASTNTLTVHIDNQAEPWLGDPDGYIFQTLEAAIVQAWGMDGSSKAAALEARGTNKSNKATRPLYIREGGSIPAIRFLEKQFHAPAAHLPCGQASDAAHLDNERLRVVNLLKSREIFKRVFQQL